MQHESNRHGAKNAKRENIFEFSLGALGGVAVRIPR
jgi:hypothetical protein